MRTARKYRMSMPPELVELRNSLTTHATAAHHDVVVGLDLGARAVEGEKRHGSVPFGSAVAADFPVAGRAGVTVHEQRREGALDDVVGHATGEN